MTDSPVVWPAWPEVDRWTGQAVSVALLSGRLAVSGNRSPWISRAVAAGEAIAARAGRRHAVLTTNGSSAIVVALHALGIGPGDTVAMPATTWVSCATSVLRVGATPVFFDATEGSPCGDGAGLARPPSAILAIHLYAQHCPIDELRRRYPGVPIVEDASHAQFSRSGDRVVGSLGDLSIMSLQAGKIITAGEGGVILTDDPDMAVRLESLVMDSRRRSHRPPTSAVNELEAALLLHGANHSPPEISAAMLVDQLDRFDDQCARRSQGVTEFIGMLGEAGARHAADPGALRSGAFYGLAVEVPASVATADQLVDQVWRDCGLALDRIYPPVPQGPLYRPETVKQFAAIAGPATATPESERWYQRWVLVPHHAFLAGGSALEKLAAAVAGTGSPTRRRHEKTAPRPVIDVITLTVGGRTSLDEAVASVAAQDVDAEVRLTVWVEGAGTVDLPPGSEWVQVIRLDRGDARGLDQADRIATARDLAVRNSTGDYIAFLDDDNAWAPDHLSSLLASLGPGILAAHSWRTLTSADGTPTVVDRFPWLPPGEESRRRFEDLARAGVMTPDEAVVRDSADVVLPDGGKGMVDMGEWIFDRRLLAQLYFHRPRTAEEIAGRLGEDDILLEQIVRLGIPTACSRRPTLHYRLGGMSNPEYSVAP